MTAYLDGYSGYSGVPEDAAAEILEKLMTHQQGRPAAHCQPT